MMLGRDRPSLPRFLTKRAFATQRFTTCAERVLPLLRLVEKVSRSRWHAPHALAKRAVGLLVLLLAISGVGPLPLINVLPVLTIALLAIAYLQDDGLLLAAAATIGISSLLIFGLVLWTSAGALRLFLRHGCFDKGPMIPCPISFWRRARRSMLPRSKAPTVSEPARWPR